MAQVRWTRSAVDDLGAIVEFIARDSPLYAERFESEIVARPRRLKRFPESGSIVPEFADASIREIVHGAYRIIYQVRANTCHILAVVHSGRDLPRHFDPKNRGPS